MLSHLSHMPLKRANIWAIFPLARMQGPGKQGGAEETVPLTTALCHSLKWCLLSHPWCCGLGGFGAVVSASSGQFDVSTWLGLAPSYSTKHISLSVAGRYSVDTINTYTQSTLSKGEPILDNLGGPGLISWKALRAELRFPRRRNILCELQLQLLPRVPACPSWRPALWISDSPSQSPQSGKPILCKKIVHFFWWNPDWYSVWGKMTCPRRWVMTVLGGTSCCLTNRQRRDPCVDQGGWSQKPRGKWHNRGIEFLYVGPGDSLGYFWVLPCPTVRDSGKTIVKV